MFSWIKKNASRTPEAKPERTALDSGHKARGKACIERGDWESAAACYRDAIASAPGDAEAHINLGFVLARQRHHAGAQEALQRALVLDPRSVDAHYILGTIAAEQGDLPQVIERFGSALAIKPDFVIAYRGLLDALMQTGQDVRAGEAVAQGIAHNPGSAELRCWQGQLCAHRGEFEDAIQCFVNALSLDPDHIESRFSMALALHATDRFGDAADHLRRVLVQKPDWPEAHCNLGKALQALGQPEQAIQSYRTAISLRHDYFDALFCCGNALAAMERFEEALRCYDESIRLWPDNAAATSNRGVALQGLNRLDEALTSFDRAIELNPDYADPVFNRGKLLGRLGRYREGLASYAAALRLQSGPAHANTRFHEGLYELVMGDFASGWKKFELRWETVLKGRKRHFNEPLWLGGQPLNGKTILLHAEQGFGDTIQFCRYAKLVADLGATVLLDAPPPLHALLADLDGVQRILRQGQPNPVIDYQCPLMSLPLAFHTDLASVPAAQGYLRCDPARKHAWGTRLGEKTGPRAGLVWSGSPAHGKDQSRSIALADFVTLLVPDVEYVCLQKDVRATDQKILDGRADIANFDSELADFAETAALIANLDLVISVDTSVAHLAGAMGKPVWLLVAFDPDWRWLLEREDSPWYRSMRIFRQSAIGDWAGVLARVKLELNNWKRQQTEP